MDEPTPASVSTNTSWPFRTSSCTPDGVIATRYSWFLTSRGIPTFTVTRPLRAPPTRGAVAARSDPALGWQPESSGGSAGVPRPRGGRLSPVRRPGIHPAGPPVVRPVVHPVVHEEPPMRLYSALPARA